MNVLIIGAGPAGLTAAYELLQRGKGVQVTVLEASDNVGGISRTYCYKGNRIDIGGHRFFSKSDRVMDWWLNILPLEEEAGKIYFQGKSKDICRISLTESNSDDVMLLRQRISRILYSRHFFEYPISLSMQTLKYLGIFPSFRILASYIKARILPIRTEKSLEDFMINRFGSYLYRCFFKDYTEKVWGVPCTDIPADWGKQRIKGVSLTKAILQAVKKCLHIQDFSLSQKKTETSFIERFLYPKYGPGHMWEKVADKVKEKGGNIIFNTVATGISLTPDGKASKVFAKNKNTEDNINLSFDYIISSMPILNFIDGITPSPPERILSISRELPYRDFITVGILCKKLVIKNINSASELPQKLPDTWIYIQEPDVKVGRLQIFNNWSPALVADPEKIWLGLEYFLNEKDEFWSWSDEKIKDFAIDEMMKLRILDQNDVEDGVVIRIKKAYPAYFGSYQNFNEVKSYLDSLKNIFFVGRNGQHRYNNQDHSMLTAMTVVDGLLSGEVDRNAVWSVNTEEDYHEEKKSVSYENH